MFSVITSLLYGDQTGIVHRRSIARVFMSYDSAAGAETIDGGQRVIAVPLSLSDFDALGSLPTDSALESFSVQGEQPMTVSVDGVKTRVEGAFVSGGYFATLRTPAVAGRMLTPADDQPGAPPVAVVTDHFYRTRLGGSASALGRPIVIAGTSYAVVGVALARFHGMSPLEPGEDDSLGTQVWLPLEHARRLLVERTDVGGRLAELADVDSDLSAL